MKDKDKEIDTITEEEERERIYDVAIDEGYSSSDASYMQHMWENF